MTQAAASAGSELSDPPPAGRRLVLILVLGALTALAPLAAAASRAPRAAERT
ncbi:hypothetical protein [Actinomadura sp. NPDC049753]|uniref:hypothetical protein n=1 Tax=Actinomadura sp. NPDC049753 TaxID=3154739 RepID=UPI003444CE9A